MKKLIFIIFACLQSYFALGQHVLNGKVISSKDAKELEGVTVRLKGTLSAVSTGADGGFSLFSNTDSVVLQFSAVGYLKRELSLHLPLSKPLLVTLVDQNNELQEVVVSTGYQNLPKERATGSFFKVDSALLNRRVGTNIINRLADAVPGLIFNKNLKIGESENNISIRGQSTLFAETQPLIVLDNFPYEGDITNINPNDVENITVLKDAAAASIWGARAGNGVIVITTRKAKFNTPLKVELNSNVTIGQRPDVFYNSKMSTADFIDMEKTLFNKGYYKSDENSTSHAALSPVVELLIAERDHKITSEEASQQISALSLLDVRNDFDRYLNRQSVAGQYALSLRGGTDKQRYSLSAGYDHNLLSLKENSFSRLTLRGNSTYLLTKNLELSTSIYFTSSMQKQNNNGGSSSLYPYAKLADEFGNPLAVTGDYRLSFLENSMDNGLLDWQNRPLEEIYLANNKFGVTDYRLNLNLGYKLFPWLKAEVLYQYNNTDERLNDVYSQQTYFTRNLINNYTQVNADGSLTRPIPLGAITDRQYGKANGHNLRGQLEVNKELKDKHNLSGIAGAEIRDNHRLNNAFRMYGYDEEHAVSRPVDLVSLYSTYSGNLSNLAIPSRESETDLTDRYLSYYTNVAYQYLHRYTFSASARLDKSNLFGVRTNQQGVPLYSIGGAWELSKESFYHSKLLPYLRLRTTFGYNGNVDKSLSAYTTASYNSENTYTRLPFANIVNPPNPDLRWERVKIVNMGIDFRSSGGILSGSVEYYRKNGIDLIGSTTFPTSTGISTFKGNTADTKGEGIDVIIHSANISRKFQWSTDFMFSYITEIVERYNVKTTVANYLGGGAFGTYPLEGRPLMAIYSYKWAGLDPNTGDPRGYLNGQPSNEFTKVVQGTTLDDIVYNGPSRPPYFGALRNTFTLGSFSVSANISYRLGYYYRKNSVAYLPILRGDGGHGDYGLRWKNPGDEQFTNVPSLPASGNANRDNLYTFSSVLVERGDHVRLQDINLTYTLDRKIQSRLGLSGLQVYAYADNLGILWKKANGNEDPDYKTSKPIRTFSIGIKASL